jgi:hypothetical protein
VIADAGAQLQRTSIAWQRTMAAAIVTTGLLLRHPTTAVGLKVSSVLAVAVLGGLVRRRRLDLEPGPGPCQVSPATVRLAALTCLIFGVIAVVSTSCSGAAQAPRYRRCSAGPSTLDS